MLCFVIQYICVDKLIECARYNICCMAMDTSMASDMIQTQLYILFQMFNIGYVDICIIFNYNLYIKLFFRRETK